MKIVIEVTEENLSEAEKLELVRQLRRELQQERKSA